MDSTLGPRGRRLWDAYAAAVDGQRGLVLLEEACRIADRLDRLDALLVGDTDVWFRLVHNARTEDYEIKVDAALVEARQQASVLRQLVASLPISKESGDGDPDSWLDDLPSEVFDAEGRAVPDARPGGGGDRGEAGSSVDAVAAGRS